MEGGSMNEAPVYGSGALSFSDSVLSALKRLIKAIAFEEAKRLHKEVIQEEDIKRALSRAMQELEEAVRLSNERQYSDEIMIENMNRLSEKHVHGRVS
jgi:siroheme synthase